LPCESPLRSRPASRSLLLDPSDRVLLFRFVHKDGALAGKTYWATPGGGVDDGESFEQAAIRELWEETGLRVESVGAAIAQRMFVLQLTTGEHVMADERFFVVRTDREAISSEQWTELELEVMAEHRWWSQAELAETDERVFPENLLEMLGNAGR
jgi:8-oxo-dGTP diphosphatase